MSSSDVPFFREEESIATRMWNARKQEVPLITREHITDEDLREEALPLNKPCHGVKVEEQHVIVGTKRWPRLLRVSTYMTSFYEVIDCFSFGCCFKCVWCTFFLGIIGTFILCLCCYRLPRVIHRTPRRDTTQFQPLSKQLFVGTS